MSYSFFLSLRTTQLHLIVLSERNIERNDCVCFRVVRHFASVSSLSVENDFLVTPTARRNIESLALAICRQSPILLLGSSGVGKTATIEYLAKITGNHGISLSLSLSNILSQIFCYSSTLCSLLPMLSNFIWNLFFILKDMIKIHLGDQTDAKVLLGTYVCTDIPGEFRWCPGVLTQVIEP